MGDFKGGTSWFKNNRLFGTVILFSAGDFCGKLDNGYLIILWSKRGADGECTVIEQELFDTRFLQSVQLRLWCKLNTKRSELFQFIPRSLFDLVDKCLTVNPRLRLSAEEALRHELFAPCHESLRKHRMLRQGLRLESADHQNVHLEHGNTEESLDL